MNKLSFYDFRSVVYKRVIMCLANPGNPRCICFFWKNLKLACYSIIFCRTDLLLVENDTAIGVNSEMRLFKKSSGKKH